MVDMSCRRINRLVEERLGFCGPSGPFWSNQVSVDYAEYSQARANVIVSEDALETVEQSHRSLEITSQKVTTATL